MRQCRIAFLGRVDYQEAWDLQKALVVERNEGFIGDVLLLLEHDHVYTLGRRGKAEDILLSPEALERMGIKVVAVDRGGEVTYHGPGQLVGYPIVDLREWGGGPVKYVRTLEQALVSTLGFFGIYASTIEGLTGVWIGKRKIAAIGVKVSRGVTSHGFALNVNADLEYFSGIVPCGLHGATVTSMARELGRQVDMAQVVEVVAKEMGRAFGWQFLPAEGKVLLGVR